MAVSPRPTEHPHHPRGSAGDGAARMHADLGRLLGAHGARPADGHSRPLPPPLRLDTARAAVGPPRAPGSLRRSSRCARWNPACAAAKCGSLRCVARPRHASHARLAPPVPKQTGPKCRLCFGRAGGGAAAAPPCAGSLTLLACTRYCSIAKCSPRRPRCAPISCCGPAALLLPRVRRKLAAFRCTGPF